MILTFFLVFTVLGTTDIKAPVGFAGIPIGLVLVLIHLVGIPVTNTCVNPARSISQAVFVGGWALAQFWLFIVAPFLGAAIASAAYSALRTPDRDPDRPVSARRASRPCRASRTSGRDVKRGHRLFLFLSLIGGTRAGQA